MQTTTILCLVVALLNVSVSGATSMEERMKHLEGNFLELSGQLSIISDQIKSLISMNQHDKEEIRSATKDKPTLKKEDRTSMNPTQRQMNNTNLEERVTVLEEQMVTVNADVVELDEQVTNAEAQIVLLKSDQVLQDQRLLELEDDTEELDINIQGIELSINSLEASDVSLNQSIRDVNNLVTDLASTVESIEETVAGLSATDEDMINQINDLSSRISQLELDGTIAFHASLLEYTSIPDGSTVIFSNVNVNLGSGYDGSTGQFTVPTGGAGLYYFYMHFRVSVAEEADLDLRHNGVDVCIAYEDERNGGDSGSASCGAVISLEEGDVVDVYYDFSTDVTPLYEQPPLPFHSFTGYRVAPA